MIRVSLNGHKTAKTAYRKLAQRLTTAGPDTPLTKTTRLLRNVSVSSELRQTLTFHHALVGDLREKVLMSSRRTKWLKSRSIVGRIIKKYRFPHQLKQLGFRSLGPSEDQEFLSGRSHEYLWAKIIGKLHVAGFRGKSGLQVNTK